MAGEELNVAGTGLPVAPLEGIEAVSPVQQVQSEGRRRVAGERPAPSDATPEAPEPGLTEVRAAARLLRQAVEAAHSGIRIEVDESTERVVTKVINRETNEVIRQIPAQEVLNVLRHLREFVGLLFDVEA